MKKEIIKISQKERKRCVYTVKSKMIHNNKKETHHENDRWKEAVNVNGGCRKKFHSCSDYTFHAMHCARAQTTDQTTECID
jgi:hypothetical protein